MEELKELFGGEALNYEQFEEKVKGAGVKLADLGSGNYVAKKKYDDAEASATEYKAKYDELFGRVGDYDKIKADYEDINAKYGVLLAEKDQAEKMGLISEANVMPKFRKFVYSEVIAKTDDKTDFSTALTNYLKDNAQFVNGGKGTFVDLQNGVGVQKSDNAKINEQIRNLRSRNTL